METYFEWETPAGFRSKRSTDALKRAFKPALVQAIVSIAILTAIILFWVFGDIRRGSLAAGLFFVFGLLVVLLLVFPPIWGFMLVVTNLRGAPRSGRNVKLTKDKIIFGAGSRGYWEYKNVQSFKIVEEEFGETSIPVLEAGHFDGDYLTLGIAPDVSIDRVRAVLSERVADARKKMKSSFARKASAKLKPFAALLMCLGLIGSMIFAAEFYRASSLGEQGASGWASLAAKNGEVQLENIREWELGISEKVAKSCRSTHLLAKSNKMLMGMCTSISVFLIGSVLMLWANNIFLKHKIVRLQAYWADMINNERSEQGSDGNLDVK